MPNSFGIMETPLFLFFTLSFPFTAITYFYFFSNTSLFHKLRSLLLVPSGNHHSPPTYAVIGCLISFYNNHHRLLSWYTDLLSESPTQSVVIHRLGARKTITVNPKNVEYMLKTNFVNFPKGKPFTEILNDFLGCGIFFVDGELWHAQRKLASHQFTSRSLKQRVEIIVKEAVNEKLFPLLDSLAAAADSDNARLVEIDLQEVLKRLGFDIVCKLSLGFDPCCLGNEDSLSDLIPILKAFDSAAEISARRAVIPISATWKFKRMLGIGSEIILKDSIKQIHEYIGKIVHERKKNMIKSCDTNQDLLSKLIMDGVNEELTRDMVISFIMAGRDRTSAAMTWLFYALSINVHVEKELVNEIMYEFKEGEFENLKEMKYLQACICETMRLYPPVSWDSKHAVDVYVLPDGTMIRAGDRVTYFPYGMGRMESLWGWTGWILDRTGGLILNRVNRMKKKEMLKLKEVSSYKYPVFHAGPRVCLGKGLANVQMSYVVASILDRFEVKPIGPLQEAVYLPLLTAHMDGGFKVSI